MFRQSVLASLAAGVALTTLGFAPAAAPASIALRDDDHAPYQKILDAVGPALVTVKFVMKTPDDQGAGDSEEEINGILIDPKGLVLVSHWSIGGAYARFAPGGAAPKPQDVRVLIGDDTEGKKARVVSHDSELDLAWIKLEEEPAQPLKHLSLDSPPEAAVGERVFLLSRMDKFFGRSPLINEGRIRGVATQPRHLYAPTSTMLAGPGDLGMVVFNADAKPVGVMVVQIPDQESMQATQNMGGGPMILPIADVAKATKRALEAPAETTPAAPAAAPASGPAPAGTPEKK